MSDDEKTPWDRQREWEIEQKAKLGISRPLEETAFLLHECEKINEEQAAEIARLTAENERLASDYNVAREAHDRRTAELAAEREARERLAAALRPFAQPERNPAYSDASHELISVTSGDLRRARAALGRK